MDKRSMNNFPLGDKNPIGFDYLKYMWDSKWFDEFSDDHFLIKAIEKRLTTFSGYEQMHINNADMFQFNSNNFADTFCINFSQKMYFMAKIFGEADIHRFVEDQLSAGKANYDEDQFFRALSELSVLSFYSSIGNAIWEKAEYEPRLSGRKNPEARFLGVVNEKNITVDIEVKTAGFNTNHRKNNIILPSVLLTNLGRKNIYNYCIEKNIKYIPPRVMKLKDFINSAAEKFELPKDKNHLNLLFINWTFSEIPFEGFREAWSLLTNEVNGILTHRDIGESIGILPEAYDKLTSVIVYTDSLNGLAFQDFRYLWNGPCFRMLALHDSDILRMVTRMNPTPYGEEWLLFDFINKTFEEKKQMYKNLQEIYEIIGENILKSQN